MHDFSKKSCFVNRGVEYQAIFLAWPWTVVGSVFREYHARCMLKTFFVDFENVLARCIRYMRGIRGLEHCLFFLTNFKITKKN
jgi:hypothetical protein